LNVLDGTAIGQCMARHPPPGAHPFSQKDEAGKPIDHILDD
jgi:hypothetical protein